MLRGSTNFLRKKKLFCDTLMNIYRWKIENKRAIKQGSNIRKCKKWHLNQIQICTTTETQIHKKSFLEVVFQESKSRTALRKEGPWPGGGTVQSQTDLRRGYTAQPVTESSSSPSSSASHTNIVFTIMIMIIHDNDQAEPVSRWAAEGRSASHLKVGAPGWCRSLYLYFWLWLCLLLCFWFK